MSADERCERCRFWLIEQESEDQKPSESFGWCRRNPPTIVDHMARQAIPPVGFGGHCYDPEDIATVRNVHNAGLFPATYATTWCGHFAASQTPGHVDLLRERNALIDWLDSDERTEAEASEGCGRLNRLDTLIEESPAATLSDAVAKLVLLAQIAAEGHEVTDTSAAAVLRDVMPIVGMGRVAL